jgi:hypothetical protein
MTHIYVVFSGEWYYPKGGYKDYRRTYSTINEAIDYANYKVREDDDGWAHVVDVWSGSIVYECTFHGIRSCDRSEDGR